MGEVIIIQVGQAGIQLGQQCWELLTLEHGIDTQNGGISPTQEHNTQNILFEEIKNGKYIARTIFIDLEPTIIDQTKNGQLKEIFGNHSFINGKEDASNNYARGMYTVGRQLQVEIEEKITKIVERCDKLQGFIILHSISGGTGSGLVSLILQSLKQTFGQKVQVFTFTISPSQNYQSVIVESYNAILSFQEIIHSSDLTVLYNNEALYNICQNTLGHDLASFIDINQMIAQSLSQFTNIRMEGEQSFKLNTITTNLVNYPTIKFILQSSSPWITPDQMHFQSKTSDISKQIFQKEYFSNNCDPSKGSYMACSLLYQGDISQYEAMQASKEIKMMKDVKFPEWSPTGFQVGFNTEKQRILPNSHFGQYKRQVSMFANTTAVDQQFEWIHHKFDLMYAKRAFVHWFVGEGLEEREFHEARESVAGLVKDYNIDFGCCQVEEEG